MRKAGAALSKKKLEGTILYSTLEPCYGCGFFITYTNIKTVVWAFTDPYKGGIDDLTKLSKVKDSFKKIQFVIEPDESLKKESQKFMYDYFVSLGNLEKAKLFL